MEPLTKRSFFVFSLIEMTQVTLAVTLFISYNALQQQTMSPYHATSVRIFSGII